MRFLSTLVLAGLFAPAALAGSIPLGHTPTEISMQVEIDAPITEVWAEFSQIGNIYLNSPTVDHSYLSSDVTAGVGATRHMEMSLKKGASLDERVIAWTEGSYMALEVYEMHKMPGVQTMGGDFRLEERGDKTLLVSTLNYSMNNALFGAMNKAVMNKKFSGLWASILTGYKTHIETGAEVTATTELDTSSVKLLSVEIGVEDDSLVSR